MPRTPTPALNSFNAVNDPYLPQKEPIIDIVHRGKAVVRKSYYVEGTVNRVKAIFLVDTGWDVQIPVLLILPNNLYQHVVHCTNVSLRSSI